MKAKTKLDPERIAARMNKGWAFLGEMTLEQYRARVQHVKDDLAQMPRAQFVEKYKTYIW